MKSQLYPKDKLLERIQANRSGHRALFEEAIAGYEATAVKRLQAMIKQIKDKDYPEQLWVNIPVPHDHTADYDAIIDQLNMTDAKEIELSDNEFRMYVRDEWNWKAEFTATSSNYVGTANR